MNLEQIVAAHEELKEDILLRQVWEKRNLELMAYLRRNFNFLFNAECNAELVSGKYIPRDVYHFPPCIQFEYKTERFFIFPRPEGLGDEVECTLSKANDCNQRVMINLSDAAGDVARFLRRFTT